MKVLRRPEPRPRAHVAAGATIGVVLCLCLLPVRTALSQMVSSGATDQPVRPLPPGITAPVVNFRDIGPEAGLKAVVISGDLNQTFVVENTGTGVAVLD